MISQPAPVFITSRGGAKQGQLKPWTISDATRRVFIGLWWVDLSGHAWAFQSCWTFSRSLYSNDWVSCSWLLLLKKSWTSVRQQWCFWIDAIVFVKAPKSLLLYKAVSSCSIESVFTLCKLSASSSQICLNMECHVAWEESCTRRASSIQPAERNIQILLSITFWSVPRRSKI